MRNRGEHECSPLFDSVVCCVVLLTRNDIDYAPTTLDTELHGAGRQGKQRVVSAAAHILAGVEVGAALADEDLAGIHGLSAEPLHTQVLSVRITTVTS